jgi:hypothetical protein
VGAGICIMSADQAGNANYNAAPQVVQSFTVAKANQTIAFGALGNKGVFDPPFTVSATGGASGNPVTFTAGPPFVCTAGGANGATITLVGVGAGTCTVTADQSGNANYNAAPSVPQSFTVN